MKQLKSTRRIKPYNTGPPASLIEPRPQKIYESAHAQFYKNEDQFGVHIGKLLLTNPIALSHQLILLIQWFCIIYV